MSAPTTNRVSVIPLRYFDADSITSVLDFDGVVEKQKEALAALGRDNAAPVPRLLLPFGSDDVAFSYLAQLSPTGPVVAKIGTVVPQNRERDVPTVSAVVFAFDADTGAPSIMLEGEIVTLQRTVAASIVAAEVLARSSRNVAVIGFGTQGTAHAQAVLKRLQPETMAIWSRSPFSLGALDETAGSTVLRIASSAQDAAAGADLIITCTSSAEPVLRSEWVSTGTTVISVGSFAPERCEVDTALVSRAHVVADHVQTALSQAGPIIAACRTGRIRADDVHQISQYLSAEATPWSADTDIVFYNSVGLGIQDAAFVEYFLAQLESVSRAGEQPWK